MIARLVLLFVLISLLAACGSAEPTLEKDDGHAEAAGEFERGPHRGRMLRDGAFALEVTIFETDVPPHYRLYAYQDGKPLEPSRIDASVELTRLDGETNRFSFRPENDYLVGSGTVAEPHSFDVRVSAGNAGRTHRWTFASYEGRTSIPEAVAKDAGIVIETAGPATIRDQVQLTGSVVLDASRHAAIKARFPGIVRAVHVQQGDRVRRGQTLAEIEGNESMRRYLVPAPFDGIVLVRNGNPGDVADGNILLEVADLSEMWVDVQAIGRDAARLAPGQAMRVAAATGDETQSTIIKALLPLTTRGQSVTARARLANPEGRWRPGMAVSALVTVAEKQVPLAVKESGLQRFRDFIVVFAQVGQTYEARMLELGARDGEHAQVLGGLKPGTRYVAGQSFLIKADIEKTGASHDH